MRPCPVERPCRAGGAAVSGHPAERKFLAPGINEGEVLTRVGVPDIKRQTIEDAGAHIFVEGANWNESCVAARRIAAERGMLMWLYVGIAAVVIVGVAAFLANK